MINYLYKPPKSRIWRGRFRLQDNRGITSVSLKTSDKQVARKRLEELVLEQEREAAGILAPKIQREAAQRKMTEHLDDFVADLEVRGRAERYISNIQFRTGRLITDCGWVRPGNVTADSFQMWRKQQQCSPKTLNDYLGAATALLNWMERNQRIVQNPLKIVGKVETQGGETRQRRAFSDDEMQRLLAVKSPYRAIYLLAVYTGLRRSEMEKLKWSDVHLDGGAPFISVRATTTKNHKPAVLRLHADVVVALRELKQHGVGDGVLVFERIPRIKRFRNDLKRAGIAYVDAQGQVADIHSLRKTFCTNLARHGVPSRVAMDLMRHSDRRLTDKIYTDENLLGSGAAVESLPSLTKIQTKPVTQPVTQLLTQTSATEGRGESRSDTPTGSSDSEESPVNIGQSHALAPQGTPGQKQTNWRERRGSNPLHLQCRLR